MPELAAVRTYDPDAFETLVVGIPAGFVTNPDNEVIWYTTQAPSLWRVRVVHLHGRVSGTMGTAQLSLEWNISGFAGSPWTNGANDSGPTFGSPQVLNPGDSFSYTWSTEVGTNYLGTNPNFGKTATLGIPLMYLPGRTDIGLAINYLGGFDGDLIPRDGFIELDYFTHTGAGGDSGAYELWLQPVA